MLIILFIILNNSIILRSYKNYCKSPQFLCQKITPPSTALSFIKDESTGKAYLGNWPGTTMILLEDHMWTISFSTADMLVSPKIIFNEGIGGSQTSGFDAVNKRSIHIRRIYPHRSFANRSQRSYNHSAKWCNPHHLSRGTRHQRGVCIRQIVPLHP